MKKSSYIYCNDVIKDFTLKIRQSQKGGQRIL